MRGWLLHCKAVLFLVKFGVVSAPVGLQRLHLHSQQGCVAPMQRAAPAEEFEGRNWLIDVLEIAASISQWHHVSGVTGDCCLF